jgi:hypothetical protein
MPEDQHLRPLERRIRRLLSDGVPEAEIASRFRRSPAFIRQVIELSELPDRAAVSPSGQLRPIERRVLRWRDQGTDLTELSRRFRRGPESVEEVEHLARYKLSR